MANRSARSSAAKRTAGRVPKTAPKAASAQPKARQPLLTPARRRELIGAAIVAGSVVTAATFVSGGGAASSPWLGALGWLFGWGKYAFPFLTGAIGAWLVVDAVDGRIDVARERVVGVIVTALALLAGLHLVLALGVPAGQLTGDVARLRAVFDADPGGGQVGYGIAYALVRNLGLVPSLALLAVVAFVAASVAAGSTVAGTLHAVGEGLFRAGRVVWQALDRSLAALARSFPADLLRGAEAPPASDGALALAPDGLDVGWGDWPPDAVAADADAAAAGRDAGADVAVARDLDDPDTPLDPGPTPPPRPPSPAWRLPAVDAVLAEATAAEAVPDDAESMARTIESTLAEFGIPVRVVKINRGPRITQFGLEPGTIEKNGVRSRVKVSRIVALQNDLALALAAAPIRMQAPVPGRPYLGIEVPNNAEDAVTLRMILETDAFQRLAARGGLPLALGRDIGGQPVVADLTKMPHLLIAGATGAGKSVAINTLVCSLLVTHTPETLKLLLVDPTRVELVGYRGLPHLAAPVVVDVERVVGVLQWLVREMERRYREFAERGARNIENWNRLQAERGQPPLPYLVLIIDELADLMMLAPEETERLITRLAQLARATGIHLVLATQRPSVDVVTGLIKANFPARMAFAVSSSIDSRVILDSVGAEKLLGRGDMLYMGSDSSKLRRLQGCYLSDEEIERLVRFWKFDARPPATGGPDGADMRLTLGLPEPLIQPELWDKMLDPEPADAADGRDALWDEAVAVVRAHRTASTSFLQRKLRIGYSRAARLIDELEEAGLVGPSQGGSHGREVLAGAEEGLAPGTPAPAEAATGAALGSPARNEDDRSGVWGIDDEEPPRAGH